MIAYGQYKGRRFDVAQPVCGVEDAADKPAPGRPGVGRPVVLDGTLKFDTISECAGAIGCAFSSLSTALREGRRCYGHEVEYAEVAI